MDPFVEIYVAHDVPHAYVFKSILEARGIPVQILGEYLQGAVGDLPTGMDTAPRVLVPRSKAEEAARILEEVRRRGEDDSAYEEDLEQDLQQDVEPDSDPDR